MTDLAASLITRKRVEGYAVSSGLPSYEDGGALNPAEFGQGSFAAVRDMATSLAPTLATETDRLKVALILRDQIYWRVRMEATPPGYSPWLDVERAYRENVVDRLYGHQCGGRAILFLIACRAFGIRARYVGLFDQVVNVNPQTAFVHATSDILIGGRWIACDGHYNVTLRDEYGWRIGWADVRSRLQTDRRVIVATDGCDQTPLITPAHFLNDVYGTTLKALTAFMDVSVHHDGTAIRPASVETQGWNGIVSYIDGTTADVVGDANGGVYAMLAQSWA